MASRSSRRGHGNGLDAWPGYVDALSVLLMVIVFVLMVFVSAQGFLTAALSGRDRALDRLNQQISELTSVLALERGQTQELRLSLSQLTRDLQSMTTARDTLTQQLTTLRTEQAATASERDSLRSERDRLSGQLSDATTQSRTLEETLNTTREQAEAQAREATSLADQVRALTALRDELERRAQDAAARNMTDEERQAALNAQLADERRLSESARAQVALLNRQMEELRAQLSQISTALEVSEAADRDKAAQIANLGSRLNAALAQRVEELQRYRSDFFGRLRDVLGNRPGIQIVGDRFVFQSEVLFPVGNADLSEAGQEQIRRLATTLKELMTQLPADLPWVMRIDGHADRTPVARSFASNWELSTQRAINVVKLLAAEGVPPNRLAAAGFGEFQPIDPGSSPEAFARNRRIEIRLTDR